MKTKLEAMVLLEKEWFIEAPWGRICIVAWGNCYDPPVLACHGAMDTAASFRPLMKVLPQKFYYIGIELPGNGKSDPFPPGVVLSLYDFVYAIHVVVRHFRWESFSVMAHSLGAAVANTYNLCYPGKINRFVQFDPVFCKTLKPGDFHGWYQISYGAYFNNTDFYNAALEDTKKFTIEEALQNLMNRRNLTLECAQATLERMSVPAGDGFVRLNYDRRMKILQTPPFSPEHYRELYTRLKTPTLSIIAQDTIDKGSFDTISFVLDERSYPHGNCRIKFVNGGHDVHFVNPKSVAPHVAEFLLNINSKAKL